MLRSCRTTTSRYAHTPNPAWTTPSTSMTAVNAFHWMPNVTLRSGGAAARVPPSEIDAMVWSEPPGQHHGQKRPVIVAWSGGVLDLGDGGRAVDAVDLGPHAPMLVPPAARSQGEVVRESARPFG